MKHLAALALVATLSSSMAAGDAPKPPTPYVDEGACPFECCTYREWSVEERTTLFSSTDERSDVIAVVAKGERVVGLTGKVVVTVPGQIEVLRSHRSEASKVQYKKRDIVWVYTNLGEGYYRVWYKGKVFDEEATFFGVGSWDRCETDGTCWGKSIREPESTWWVKVKTGGGLIGWSRHPENFGNKDSCG